jgi:glycosyltransferase involved in cell wall biosynthesis
MRVAHVIADGGWGGGSVHVLEQLRAAGDGECALLTQPGSYLDGEARRSGILRAPVAGIGGRVSARTVLRLRAAVRAVRPSIVHVHGGRAAFLHALAVDGLRTVYTVHGCHYAHRRGIARPVAVARERFVTARAGAVVFVCEHDRHVARATGAIAPQTETYVIRNGIPSGVGGTAAAPVRGRVLFVGRLEHPKDPELFLRTMTRLPRHTGAVIGSGSLEGRVHALRHQLGLQGRVEMLGEHTREATLAALSVADVLLLPSRWEGLPFVVLEAAALGVPVVATAAGGVPEAVADGRTGLIVNERTPDALAEAVIRVTEDRALRRSMSEAARIHARDFDVSRMTAQTRGVYEELMQT